LPVVNRAPSSPVSQRDARRDGRPTAPFPAIWWQPGFWLTGFLVTGLFTLVAVAGGDWGLRLATSAAALTAAAFGLLLLRREATARAELERLRSELAAAQAARVAAEDASRAKSTFLATMSHELRTPLNAILGFSEVMKTEVMGPLANPIYKDYAGNIHDSGAHLLHLINDLLDLSRIEAGRYELYEEDVRLADIVDDCCRLLALKAEARSIAIEVDCTGELPPVRADERAMRQVCLNLLTNAVKFTPDGGTVRVALSEDGSRWQSVTVVDSGPGMSDEEIALVLEPYRQGSAARRSGEHGTGLGLPIVHRLVKLHGGRFVLGSKPGHGTQAVVALPPGR
jgi:two-component system cell cycle sensor histidine kinase PleC